MVYKVQKTGEDTNNIILHSQTIENVNEKDATSCSLEPGQASLHHGWTIHSSSPNYSHERRIG